MLSDKEVNHPTNQMGRLRKLESLEERVQKTVSQLLCLDVHEQIMISREQS
jgi:hypothetical protein